MDNRFGKNNCPPRMNDPRLFTSFTNKSVSMEAFRKKNNLKSSTEFREFLQKNATNIMNSNTVNTMKKATCNPGFNSSKGCNYCCN